MKQNNVDQSDVCYHYLKGLNWFGQMPGSSGRANALAYIAFKFSPGNVSGIPECGNYVINCNNHVTILNDGCYTFTRVIFGTIYNHRVRFGEAPYIVLSKYRQFRLGRFGRDYPERTY